MSQIADLGVNFKMTGGSEFESRMKSMESQFKSLSEAFNQTPAVNKHFEKMTTAAQGAHDKISSIMTATKAVVLGVLTAKAGAGLFDWALGSEAVAKAKIRRQPLMNPDDVKAYEGEMAGIRKRHEATKDDLINSSYEINSAMSKRPLKEQLEAYKTMPYYATLLGKSNTEAAQFYKGFLASVASGLPEEKRKNFHNDILGYLAAAGKITSANPEDIAAGAGKLGKMYTAMGQSPAQLFADIAYASPMIGNKPEEAATAIRALLSRSGQTMQKMGEAKYESDYVRGRLVGTKDWGSMEDLKFAAATGDKRAKHDLAELAANRELKGAKVAKYAHDILYEEKDMAKFWDYMGSMSDDIKRDRGGMRKLTEALGEEHVNVAFGMIEGYQKKLIENTRAAMEAQSGEAYKKDVDAAKSKELPELWTLVKQGAEDFSTSLRSIFYEPMKFLLEEWRTVFTNLEQGFSGPSGLKKIQEYASAFVGGSREGWQGQPATQDNRSAGQMFQDFVGSLSADDFREAGKKITTAASDFVEIMGQLKTIIGTVHKLLSAITSSESMVPLAASIMAAKGAKYVGAGPVTQAIVATAAYAATDIAMGPPKEQTAEQAEARAVEIEAENYQRSLQRNTPQIVAMPSSGNNAEGSGVVQGNFVGDIKMGSMTLEVDGEGVATAVVRNHGDILSGYIRGELEKARGGNRANANDQPLMGTN